MANTLVPQYSRRILTSVLTYGTFLGLDAAEKKFGQGKVDPGQARGVNEKVTDKARSVVEGISG